MTWTDSQRRAWQRTLATTQSLDGIVQRLERMRPYMPKFDDMIRELALRHANAKMIAEIALAADEG